MLERKGARVALVTTAGFEDALEIGRQARPKLYDFFFDRVEPLVPHDLRFGVNERVSSDGEILTAPDKKNCNYWHRSSPPPNHKPSLFHSSSFANPANEQTVAESLKV